MGISVYYNLNHHCFKCSYSPQVSSKFKIDHIDKFGRYFILYIDKSTTHSRKLSVRRYHRRFKVFLGDLLIKYGNKLSQRPNSTNKANNWYMWRR